MIRNWLIYVALALAICTSACSTANVGTVVAPDGSARNTAFAVSTEDGLGTFTPRLELEQADGFTVAKVFVEQAAGLEAAYVNLAYDSTQYSPDRVEIAELLGGGGEVVTLALTNLRDVVPIGAAQIAGTTAQPVTGAGLLATVYFRNTPFTAARAAAGAPGNAANAVDDLKIIDQQPGSVSLAWTEKNIGDYDNNGEVSISDLTPIALLYGQLVATAADPIWAGMVDGDGNGEINSADITPIGVNFGNQLAGYSVYTDEAGTQLISGSDDCTCDRSTFLLNNKTPVQYSFVADTELTTFTVRPVDSPSGGTAGVVSNVAMIVNVPGPPDAPTNLTASASELIGHQTVQLNWTAATHADLAGYEIERKASADGDGAWVKIQQVGAGTTAYTDTDETLTEVSYDYRVRSKDMTEQFSDYSNIASVVPFFLPAPSPPQNLTSTNEIATGNAIQLNWEAPLDGSALRFFVYGKGPGEMEFTQIGGTPNAGITTYLHTNLIDGETYEYYVTSFGLGGQESEASNTVSNTPSGAAAIEITSLTTDKWTHYANGGDATPATFTVETNVAPDSVDWECSVGAVTGSGSTVTYKPPMGTAAQVVTVTCTVHKGAGQAVGTLKQYLTDNQIYTLGSGGGKHIEIAGYPSVFNPTEPYMAFSELLEGEGHVSIVTKWGVWCVYCRLEMPDFQSYVEMWGDQGMYVTGVNHWDADGGAAWLASNGCPDIDTYIVPQSFTEEWQTYCGVTQSISSAPANLIVDRDGNIRKYQAGSLTYNAPDKAATEKLLKELLGVS